MSTNDGVQQTLDGGQRISRGHLKTRVPSKHRGNTEPIRDGTDRERWCTVCHRRVTIADERDGEYGHEPGCEYRPQGWPQ